MDPQESVRAPGEQGTTRAACANHPQMTAVITCSRCGDYACSACAGPRSAARPLCKKCGGTDFEARRKELGPHERQVRAISLYLWLSGGGMAIGWIAVLPMMLATREVGAPSSGVFVASFLLVPFAGLYCAAAWNLQRLNKAGRVLGVIAALPGLCSVPVGTLISGFMLWILLSKKGEAVFSDEYREVVAGTPHLHYGVSIVTKIALGFLIAIMVAGFLAAMFAGK